MELRENYQKLNLELITLIFGALGFLGAFSETTNIHVSIKTHKYSGHVWDARPFSDHYRLDEVMESVYPIYRCEIACDQHTLCLSFNYNSVHRLCELLSTDVTLQNMTYRHVTDVSKSQSWIHRFLGKGKTKFCPDWPNCVELDMNQFRHELSVTETKKNEHTVTLFWHFHDVNSELISLCGGFEFIQNGHSVGTATCGINNFTFVNLLPFDGTSQNLIEMRILNIHDKDFMKPREISFHTPPTGSGFFNTTATSNGTQIQVSWNRESFQGQQIGSIRIYTEPDDGSCPRGRYCEIQLKQDNFTDEVYQETFTITGLILGRAYGVYMGLVNRLSGSSVPVLAFDSPTGLVPPKVSHVQIELPGDSPEEVTVIVNFTQIGEVGRLILEITEINSGDSSTVKRFRKYPPGKLVDNPLVETFKGFTYATHHIGVFYVQNSRESSNVLQDQYDVDFETLPKKADYSVLATDTGHVTFFWHDSNDTKVDEIELSLCDMTKNPCDDSFTLNSTAISDKNISYLFTFERGEDYIFSVRYKYTGVNESTMIVGGWSLHWFEIQELQFTAQLKGACGSTLSINVDPDSPSGEYQFQVFKKRPPNSLEQGLVFGELLGTLSGESGGELDRSAFSGSFGTSLHYLVCPKLNDTKKLCKSFEAALSGSTSSSIEVCLTTGNNQYDDTNGIFVGTLTLGSGITCTGTLDGTSGQSLEKGQRDCFLFTCIDEVSLCDLDPFFSATFNVPMPTGSNRWAMTNAEILLPMFILHGDCGNTGEKTSMNKLCTFPPSLSVRR